MIFDKDLEQKIQKAIDLKDSDFLKSLIKDKKPKKVEKKLHSFLMVPANRAKFLNKIDEIEADGVIINLEDGVAREFKKIALYAAMAFISNLEAKVAVIVRVNPLDEGGLEEIKELNRVYPDMVRVAKIKTEDEIKKTRAILNKEIKLQISVETKEAFRDLAKFTDLEIDACYLGILDLLADLGLPHSILKRENPTIDYILSKFLIDSKTIEALPVSFVYQDYKNLDEFKRWCEYEKEMGFEAKVAISPSQLKIVNSIFLFDEEEIKRAEYIKRVFEENLKKGISGFSDEKYGFIDEPIYKDALNVLKKRR